MPSCARCGADTDENPSGDYDYCGECKELFETVREEGVFIRSRHGNRLFDEWPYTAPRPGREKNRAHSQVEALALAKDKMESEGVRGVFHYQKTGSWWLIDEYLQAHPSIADDVEAERSGILSRLLPW